MCIPTKTFSRRSTMLRNQHRNQCTCWTLIITSWLLWVIHPSFIFGVYRHLPSVFTQAWIKWTGLHASTSILKCLNGLCITLIVISQVDASDLPDYWSVHYTPHLNVVYKTYSLGTPLLILLPKDDNGSKSAGYGRKKGTLSDGGERSQTGWVNSIQ